MANDIIPQDLLIYRDILRGCLAKLTNEQYGNKNKLSFHFEFVKLEGKARPTIFIEKNKVTYLFKVFCIDKSRNPIGETIPLYHNFYIKPFDTTIYQLEREAIKGWFINASSALFNVLSDAYKEEVTAKQELIDKRAAQGITAENIAAEVTAKEQKDLFAREQDILKMMTPDIKY